MPQRSKKSPSIIPASSGQAVGTSEPFDYTEAEWSKIAASIAHLPNLSPFEKLMTGPSFDVPIQTKHIIGNCHGLPPETPRLGARIYLREVGRRYQRGLTERPQLIKQRKLAKQSWSKVSRASQELAALLSACMVTDAPTTPSEIGTFGRFLDVLHELRLKAASMVTFRYGIPIDNVEEFFRSGRLGDPRLLFQFSVLNFWTDIGGKLQISRHPKYQTIGGPLARYFALATHAVMGSSAPSLESLPDILARQKIMKTKLEELRNSALP